MFKNWEFLLISFNILENLAMQILCHINERYKISKRRVRNVPPKLSGSSYMATQLTEGTDLNHCQSNQCKLNYITVILTETLNSNFKILAVLLCTG
jgi:hypothetical protein